MNPEDKIKKLIDESKITADTQTEKKILSEAMEHLDKFKKQKSLSFGPDKWRIIMISKMTKLTASIVIVIGLLFSLYWFCSTTPAYGITDAVELLRNVETVHIKGWEYLHTGDDAQLEKFPFEFRLDKKNGCSRHLRPLGRYGDHTADEPTYSLNVFDGVYIMKTKYRGNRGTAEFMKLNPFMQRLRMRTMEIFPGYMLNPHNVEGFVKIGQEHIKNKIFDIWEGEIVAPDKKVPYKKYKIWLSPSTGEIARILYWMNAEEDSIRWVMRRDAHTIEYNIVPSEGYFKTEAPEGYKLANTKETAIEKGLGDSDGVRFHDCIGFTLEDGSVIYGWHANHEPEKSQANLFKNLKPGDSLPDLPAQITGLKPWPVKGDITFTGRHLTYTRKKGKFYEWGIYIPNKKIPSRDTFQDYKVISKYNGVEPRRFGGRPNLIRQELVISSEEEFNDWVLGAMAELSDDGLAPKNIAYENALQLAERIRKSFKK